MDPAGTGGANAKGLFVHEGPVLGGLRATVTYLIDGSAEGCSFVRSFVSLTRLSGARDLNAYVYTYTNSPIGPSGIPTQTYSRFCVFFVDSSLVAW